MTHRHVQNNACHTEQLKPSYRIIILLNIKDLLKLYILGQNVNQVLRRYWRELKQTSHSRDKEM